MKLKACERCGKRTAEGLTLCPDCMKESGAAPRPEQREAATQSGGVMLITGDESGPLPPEFVDFIKRRFE